MELTDLVEESRPRGSDPSIIEHGIGGITIATNGSADPSDESPSAGVRAEVLGDFLRGCGVELSG